MSKCICTAAMMLAAAVILLIAPAARAAGNLLYYEPFDYPAGATLNGRNGGQGFATAWSGDNGNTIASPGMTYTDANNQSLPVAGNKMIENQYYALTDRHLTGVGTSGTSTWFSFIMQSYRGSDFATLQLCGTLSINNSIYYMGRYNGGQKYDLVMHAANGTQYYADTTNSLPIDQKVLLAGRIDSGPTDNIHIWLNPTLYTGAPIDANANLFLTDVPHVDLNYLLLQNGSDSSAATSIDEIRIGLDYNSVVPEPVALGLIPIGAFLVLRRRRRSPTERPISIMHSRRAEFCRRRRRRRLP